MDNYNSFSDPLQQIDEILVFHNQIPSIPLQQLQQTIHDHNHQHALQVIPHDRYSYINGTHDLSLNHEVKIPAQKLPHDDHDLDEVSNDIKKKKKIIHRDVERQRRQEMAALYKNLRSLLPIEYLKGKRSISDHMNAAVNYIKHTENTIKMLGEKRDKLRTIPSSFGKADNLNVMVQPCGAGLVVVISSSLRDEILPLSAVLRLLVGEGLGVINCVSTKVNEITSIHTIQIEVSASTTIEPSRLEVKLMNLVGHASQIQL